jgi:hypothetical protein
LPTRPETLPGAVEVCTTLVEGEWGGLRKNQQAPSACRAAKLPQAAVSRLNLLRPYGS